MSYQLYPVHQQFSITKEQLLNPMVNSIRNEPINLIRSPNNIQCNINIFPNGRHHPSEAGLFLAFLQLKFPPENIQIHTSYNIILGGSIQRHFQQCFKSTSAFGGIICKREDLYSLIVNQRLSIELNGNISVQKNFQNPSSFSIPGNFGPSIVLGPSSSKQPRHGVDLSNRMPTSSSSSKTETEKNVEKILHNYRRIENQQQQQKSTTKNIVAETTTMMGNAAIGRTSLQGPSNHGTSTNNNENLNPSHAVGNDGEVEGTTTENHEMNVNELLSGQSYRMPAPSSSKIVENEKDLLENGRSEIEMNVARILQNHLLEEAEQRASKNVVEPLNVNGGVVASSGVEGAAPKQSASNNNNLTPPTRTSSADANGNISKKANKTVASTSEEQQELNDNELSLDDIQEPSSHSTESRTNSKDSDFVALSSSATTSIEEHPTRSKRNRTRTSRYVEFMQDYEDDDDVVIEEPATKKGRKQKGGSADASSKVAKSKNENDENLTTRRSKSVARASTRAVKKKIGDPKIVYDCKIEGVEKIFDVNKEILSQKSNAFATLFSSAQPDKSSFELEAIPDRTLEEMFNFCHGSPLKESMNNKEWYSLLYYAHTFEMPELKSLCEERLIERMSLTNVSDMRNAANMAQAEMLRNECKKYIIENLQADLSRNPRNFSSVDDELKEEVWAACYQKL